MALKHLPAANAPGAEFHSANVPWQRVINSRGTITPRGPGEASRQARVLGAEGVEVGRSSLGEYTVDFSVYGWFPGDLDD